MGAPLLTKPLTATHHTLPVLHQTARTDSGWCCVRVCARCMPSHFYRQLRWHVACSNHIRCTRTSRPSAVCEAGTESKPVPEAVLVSSISIVIRIAIQIMIRIVCVNRSIQ